MILDKLQNASRYYGMHPLFEKAFNFLQAFDMETINQGKHTLQDDELFAIVSEGTGVPQDQTRMEAHKKYIDIQYIVSGVDRMGWQDLSLCSAPSEPYTEERDVAFFPDKPNSWIDVPAGFYTIFFPEDVHAPLGSPTPHRKVVIKIAVQ
ncbi:YhcH/YjgK/YiaL family protein [Pontibacter beigongshangensis]|uniref:YhcH/YjgK/YiaL family protein n=1 Tax=Pontibacter beigongshangensis TaxID=2574733 RepID=UPI00164F45D8|nr:YhcH/YjgK/YiaL family protein [Pontibacter beigongshangensis]